MISLQPVRSPDITNLWVELGKQASFRRAFPLMRHTPFQRSVLAAKQIQDGGEVMGCLLQTKPTDEFCAYGDRESLLMIYPEYQRQGVGTQVLDRIREDWDPTFFVSSKSNPSSTAFFQKQRHLSLVDETERYRVYSLLHSGA